MTKDVRVLIVDDEPGLREVLSHRLEHWGYRCRAAADVGEAETLLESFEPDLVLTDVVMPGVSGLDLLRRLKSGKRRGVPVILMTAHGSVDAAVEAMKAGAEDFLTKPVDDDRLGVLMEAAVADLERGRQARAVEAALDSAKGIPGLIGNSPGMREIHRLIELVGASDTSVLISGESGTGKEVVARAIHQASARKAAPFVAVNAAAIPESLVESELFGHERGAFTGAVTSRAGCFEQANRGTLFLDEIGEMPVGLQPKLLRILESGQVRRLGGKGDTKIDVRVLAATNRDPGEALKEGRLREDLFYRLNVFDLKLPPLRERREDLHLLCHHFIREFNRKHRMEVEGLRESTLHHLERYAWPGNVRELRNVMERAAIVARGRWLEPSHLPAYIHGAESTEEPSLVVPIGTQAGEAERQLILRTLEHVGQNKSEAARRLGLDVKTIRNKLRSYREDAEG
ncbi:MAG: sigma-54 dependent transcriptional regulator [Gemmatimonadota bacterium]